TPWRIAERILAAHERDAKRRGEAELFALSPLAFTIRVQAGGGIRFETRAGGAVTGVVLRLGRDEMRARR
ncbi:MAG: hypothetical protein ACRELT_04485, partial [Longimicrobiales bacterium]